MAKTWLGRLLLAATLLVALAACVVSFRHALLVRMITTGEMPPLLSPGQAVPGSVWFDDYYTVERLDERTFAIGEPRYAQRNYNYLIEGSRRALFFDAGAGHRDIVPVARSLTDLPIVFMPSHFHYDHVGEGVEVDGTIVVDLPELRRRAPDDRLTLTREEHLGQVEGLPIQTFDVDEWVRPGARIDLGNRSLEVLYTPGHTPDSVSLLDREAGLLFSGDFLYPGDLYGFMSNSDLADYRQGASTVLARVGREIRIFGAHRAEAPVLPELSRDDVEDLTATLDGVREGEVTGAGFYPVRYPINDRLALLAEPRFLQSWTATHPELE